jgi:predicted XRE-type DNA-binding protein
LIHLRLKERGWTQAQAAARLGLKQPDVSKLMKARFSGFSAERLMRLLNLLDHDVRIVVTRKSARAQRGAWLRVEAA